MMAPALRSTLLYSIPLIILSFPLIAMQLTNEVNWTISDFLVMGILLFSTVFTIDFVLKKVKTLKSRLIVIFAIVILLVLVWAELAVGIVGSPLAGS
ncbi:hypothetical protein [Epilithonimonas hominis]|uniref:Uncharacterized protein n=1 Tax=Epilithonimonas hominis TaxID=420404 RepID=A0A1H6ITN8_9FLAO|nr:hypothetical protein [Epilithonimonas hominis]ROI13342.1 hypothetical protein EGH73_09480 [Epilithonimonas hominis]SEH52686.1 hypothetical protein SAMN05421793_10972 [Epilithonimonas hominis]